MLLIKTAFRNNWFTQQTLFIICILMNEFIHSKINQINGKFSKKIYALKKIKTKTINFKFHYLIKNL